MHTLTLRLQESHTGGTRDDDERNALGWMCMVLVILGAEEGVFTPAHICPCVLGTLVPPAWAGGAFGRLELMTLPLRRGGTGNSKKQ